MSFERKQDPVHDSLTIKLGCNGYTFVSYPSPKPDTNLSQNLMLLSFIALSSLPFGFQISYDLEKTRSNFHLCTSSYCLSNLSVDLNHIIKATSDLCVTKSRILQSSFDRITFCILEQSVLLAFVIPHITFLSLPTHTPPCLRWFLFRDAIL